MLQKVAPKRYDEELEKNTVNWKLLNNQLHSENLSKRPMTMLLFLQDLESIWNIMKQLCTKPTPVIFIHMNNIHRLNSKSPKNTDIFKYITAANWINFKTKTTTFGKKKRLFFLDIPTTLHP